jgi:hypothetical protein
MGTVPDIVQFRSRGHRLRLLSFGHQMSMLLGTLTSIASAYQETIIAFDLTWDQPGITKSKKTQRASEWSSINETITPA